MTDATTQGGLRERKKARTRAAIREHAIRLFRAQGYSETTVEQIAAAAEVSPSTFFRYFPTKEDVVLQDDMDVRMVEALARQPADLSPIAAIRAASRQAWNSFTEAEWDLVSEGTRLTVTVPEIRSRAMNEFARTIDAISDAMARRTGRAADDMAVRALAGAVVGVIMSVTIPQTVLAEAEASAARGTSLPPELTIGPGSWERIDAALALLESGLPL